jgi:hypothetical protein
MAVMAQIYGLYSARDGRVRYVGESFIDRALRFESHRYGPATKPLYRWFREEWTDGFPVQSALLQTCDLAMRFRIESKWILRFPDLLNEVSPLVWAEAQSAKPPLVRGIATYMRGHVFNVDGFRGVHYQKRWSRYFVWTYSAQRTARYLNNGVIAKNIWFHDLATAVDARDIHREREPTAMRPDDRQ